ncbi:MAG: rod shape-determining protein [Actinomycetota bacterium]|jgi:rod shape-determining protein MreB|nr:rod shape-determining protein [Actinomycetota bacterium]
MARDIAIDLGTANTLVWSRGQGIVLNEPTVVAVNTRNGDVLSMGHEAYSMTTNAPSHIVVDRPLRSGVITDFETTARLLRLLFGRIGLSRFSRPRVLLCVPSALTGVERRALVQAAEQAGAARAQLLEQSMAAALGIGLPVHEPIGSMVVDVGGGTSQVAVISLGGVVANKAVRRGGFDFDAAIQAYVRREYAVAIGDRAAEHLKIQIGSAYPRATEPQAEIRGRDLGTGMPRTVLIDAEEVREAIEDCVRAIVGVIAATLADCHPELTHDVITRGLELTGGGALLHGLDSRIAQESQIPVRVSQEPLAAVVTGAGRTIEEADDFRDLFSG